ncbi:hypothetical protein [Streptomyces sp. NPDC002666]
MIYAHNVHRAHVSDCPSTGRPQGMFATRSTRFMGILGIAAVGLGGLSLTAAYAAAPAKAAGEARLTDSAMPSTVETFQYPGASRILTERGITLKRGDGHITLTDCASPYDIKIESRLNNDGFCFKVTSTSAYLAMELPDAYAIWTEDHPVHATLTAEGDVTTLDVPRNDFVPVGEGDSPTGAKRSVLVELRVTG